MVYDQQPASTLKVEVIESEYQPINTTKRRGKELLLSVRHSPVEKQRSPSLLWVLFKTYWLQFLTSVAYKIPSDVMDFANPLILK